MAKRNLEQLLERSISTTRVLSIAVIILMAANAFTIYYVSQNHSVQYTATPSTGANTTNPSSSSGTLAGIDTPLNASELSVINNAPLQYYEIAGEKLLNGSLTNEVLASNTPQGNVILINGKPSVVYIGADSCVFCGENRWAMALALAKFGSFGSLYNGYSALGDGDVPTLYWGKYNITTQSDVAFGNNYSSNYINFISADYESPITGGFQVQPLSFFIQKAPNQAYTFALSFMNSTGKFQGTPFTMWGASLVTGADAIVFGNSTPSSAGNLPLAKMTHAQVLSQLKGFSDQFAWSEYAAADVYIAYTCPTINNAAPVCQLPSIQKLEIAENA